MSSASVNRQARLFALTPCVPLAREAGKGERAAGRTAVRLYTPLPQRGRGAGGEGGLYPLTPCVPLAREAGERAIDEL